VPDWETLGFEVADGVATVTLDRPARLNSFDTTMTRELHALWRGLRFDEAVRALVLTGAGDRAFCTGIDRADVIPQPRGPWMMDDPGLSIGPKTADCWKPVVAAVNGMACGGAFYLLGEVETIVAAEHATFFDPHVTYGMTAAFEPIHMHDRMPFGEIMRLSLLGNYERLSARRAYEIGLVSEVVPGPDLADAASWASGAIASQPPLAIQGTVRAIWAARELSNRQAVALGYAFVGLGTNQDSIAEGQRLFESGKRIEWRLR